MVENEMAFMGFLLGRKMARISGGFGTNELNDQI